ncbi:MAG: T9SS type A sorting domain-containing protein, partial [Sphingobacteriaceae bacterium]
IYVNKNNELLICDNYNRVVRKTFKPGLPTITSFTPTRGGAGTQVTVVGTNFYNVQNIMMGGEVQSFNRGNDKQITFTVGSTAGTDNKISIKAEGGSAQKSGFTFLPRPTITSFAPTTAKKGDIITITGTNFTADAKVNFHSIEAAAVTVVSSTTIKAKVGEGLTGYIEVKTAGGLFQIYGFTYTTPWIANFTPEKAASGEMVTLTGANYTGVTGVSFGGTPAKSFSVLSSGLIQAVVGSGKTGPVGVTSSNGTGLSSTPFTYIPPPVITSFAPDAAPLEGVVTITGTGFENIQSIKFGGIDAMSYTVVSPTTIIAKVANGKTGSITIVAAAGTGSKSGFTFIPPLELVTGTVAFCPNLTTVYPATIDVPVKVKNFKELVSLQGTFVWNGYLTFNSIVNYGHPSIGLNASNFNSIGTNGLTLVWHDATAKGKSVTDNTILFTIRFNITGLPASATNAEAQFTNYPLPMEAAHKYLGVVPVTTNAGGVNLPGITAVNASGQTTICSGESVTLSTYSAGTYQWYKNNTLISNELSNSYVAKSSGNYNVVVTTAAGCAIASSTMKVTVNPIPATPAVTTKSTVNLGDTIRLKASTITNATNYIWTTPSGSTYYGQELVLAQAYSYMAGTYSVVAVVNGCNSKAGTAKVTVNNTLVLSGRVYSPLNKTVPFVDIALTGTQTLNKRTAADGKFSFILAPGGNYVLTPVKNNDAIKTNGVTALDITFIQSHLLQKQIFDSPLKVIAADVNNSGTVSALDLVYIRRLILAIDTVFPGNRTWDFVPAEKVPPIYYPFSYNNYRNYISLNFSAANQDFIGVKMGDVNYDWNPAINGVSNTKRTTGISDDVEFYHDDIASRDMKEIVIPIKVKNFRDLLALQYTLSWNKDKFDYKAIRKNTLNIEFSDRYYTEKKIVKGGGTISDSAAGTDDDTYTIDLSVWPNPSTGNVKLNLVANEAKTITIAVVDILGKTIYQTKYNIAKGSNIIPLNLSQLAAIKSHNYFIQVIGLKKILVKQLLIINE